MMRAGKNMAEPTYCLYCWMASADCGLHHQSPVAGSSPTSTTDPPSHPTQPGSQLCKDFATSDKDNKDKTTRLHLVTRRPQVPKHPRHLTLASNWCWAFPFHELDVHLAKPWQQSNQTLMIEFVYLSEHIHRKQQNGKKLHFCPLHEFRLRLQNTWQR